MILSNLMILLWKQGVNLRSDGPSLLATILLPSALLYLASTNSGSSSKSNSSSDMIQCKIDNFLYCNYPMSIEIQPSYEDEFNNNATTISSTFFEATSNVANRLGLDYDTMFVKDPNDKTIKSAGEIRILDSSLATASWTNGENDYFAQYFVNLCNEELSNLSNPIRFQDVPNPYAYEASSAFDLRIGSFLLLIQSVGGQITQEKSTNMYYYFTRAGLRPMAFWIFQYLYWMFIGALSIGITALFGLIIGSNIQADAYFIAAWFHISFATFLSSFLTNKKYLNYLSLLLLVFGFVIPIVFSLALEQNETNENIYDAILCIPIFFFLGSTTTYQKVVGSIISTVLMLLGAYLVPLFTVSPGMYVGSRVNYLYFLSPKFWSSGIVALPKYPKELGVDEFLDDDDVVAVAAVDCKSSSTSGLNFQNCTKHFGNDKVIGPLTVNLQPGKITTLLGPNGVGKSTLMRVAAGYYIPAAGEMNLNGINTFREKPTSCLQNISFCPQDNYLYDNMTVGEHLYYMSSIRDMSRIVAGTLDVDYGDIDNHIIWILTTLDILDKKDTLAKNLSGGMKRRLCLAIATLGFPPVILCDEPSSGVDSINQRGIWKLIETMKQNSCAILLTSHTALEAVILSDSVVRMETSENIIQTNGTEGMTFSIKDEVDNITTEYDINASNYDNLAKIIAQLPNDGSEWKITSKRLTGDSLSPLDDISKDKDEEDAENIELTLNQTLEVPETQKCGEVNTIRQILILISTSLLHPDRIFFLAIFGGGLFFGQIYVMTLYPDMDDIGQLILTPLLPMIAFIASTISVVQVADVLANERASGVTKLLLSQGITRFAYLMSYVVLFSIISYPPSVIMLIGIGSIYGTSVGMFCLFIIYSSFAYLLMGVCCGFGAVLDPKTSFIATMILPSFFAIFGQGSTTETFADMYPGCVGQIISGLIIDDVDNTEWTLFVVSIVVNFLIGTIGFLALMMKLGNYNPIHSLCKKGTSSPELDHERGSNDVENHNHKILLEGNSINKAYGVGEKNTSSFKALDDVTFTIEEGSLLGLVGKSGAGKSTLMDILSGQLSPSSGRVYVEGKQVLPTDIARVVSMCGQLDTIWPKIKVQNAIKIFMLCRGYTGVHCSKGISDPYICHLIKELGIEEMMKKNVENLSGGQKRRLAFLLSLMGNTKVVLVDEAMTGVDIESRQIMWKILQDEVELRGRSVVVTSHDMGEVEHYCNTVGILHHGKLVEMGSLDEIKKKWGDSIKLICLLSSHDMVLKLKNVIEKKQPNIVVGMPLVDVLDEPAGSRIVATYPINLIELKNVTALTKTLGGYSIDPSILYWSVEPQSLDDFVRAKSQVV